MCESAREDGYIKKAARPQDRAGGGTGLEAPWGRPLKAFRLNSRTSIQTRILQTGREPEVHSDRRVEVDLCILPESLRSHALSASSWRRLQAASRLGCSGCRHLAIALILRVESFIGRRCISRAPRHVSSAVRDGMKEAMKAQEEVKRCGIEATEIFIGWSCQDRGCDGARGEHGELRGCPSQTSEACPGLSGTVQCVPLTSGHTSQLPASIESIHGPQRVSVWSLTTQDL